MRKHVKAQVSELLQSVYEVHCYLAQHLGETAYLNLCIEAVQAVLKKIETTAHTENLQAYLHAYVQEATRCATSPEWGMAQLEALDGMLGQAQDDLSAFSETTLVVFFPYNAAMWDALESVYEACEADPLCQCFVVPIPYYKANATTQQWEYAYDGDLFPKHIPITHYDDFSLATECPDIAYIHNPYDDVNLVTRVFEAYYSRNLKRYVKTLVYIPYYVTSVNYDLEEHELALPVYRYADVIVFQSTAYKEKFNHAPFYHKIVSLGSPKFDRVLQWNQNGVTMPPEWAEVVRGRKCVMLNMSISALLAQEEKMLQKLQYVFDTSAKSNVAVIFRPHPLAIATLQSMRPHLLSAYEALLEQFLARKIGVLDTTPDVSKTVALCDAYVGETASSVVTLFRVAKKPVYYLNYAFFESSEVLQRVQITQMLDVGARRFLATNFLNAVFETDATMQHLKMIRLSEAPLSQIATFPFVTQRNRHLIFSPLETTKSVCLDLDTHQIDTVFEAQEDEPYQYGFVVTYGDSIVYLPWRSAEIRVVHAETKACTLYKECLMAWKKGKNDAVAPTPMVRDYVLIGSVLYMSSMDVGSLLTFDIESGAWDIVTLEGPGFISLVHDNGFLWTDQVASGTIFKYDLEKGTYQKIEMPKEFRCHATIETPFCTAHHNLLKVGQHLMTIPAGCDAFVKIDMDTLEVTLFGQSYFEPYYNPKFPRFMCNWGYVVEGNTVLVQRAFDRQFFRIGIEGGTIEPVAHGIEKADVATIFESYDRECLNTWCIMENVYLTVDRFFETIERGNWVNREDDEYMLLSDVFDGQSGARIHKTVMRRA